MVECLSEEGRFVTFQYVHSQVMPQAKRFLAMMEEHSSTIERSPITLGQCAAGLCVYWGGVVEPLPLSETACVNHLSSSSCSPSPVAEEKPTLGGENKAFARFYRGRAGRRPSASSSLKAGRLRSRCRCVAPVIQPDSLSDTTSRVFGREDEEGR